MSPTPSSLLNTATQFGLEYSDALSLAKQIDYETKLTGVKPLKIGLLGAGNLQIIKDLVLKLAPIQGLNLDLKICDFDSQIATILNPQSFIYQDSRDILVLMSNPETLHSLLGSKKSADIEVETGVVVDEFIALIEKIRRETKARLIVGNLNNISYGFPGPKRSQLVKSLYRITKSYNQKLSEKLDKEISIWDLEFLAQKFGSAKVSNDRDWVYGKIPYSANFSVCLAQELIQLFLYDPSNQIKLIILDLDETLWGGAIAEEGPNAIELGGMSHRGESFKLLQKFLKQLKDSGILLAVCTKNDLETVTQTLKEHPEMVLGYDDFVSIQASWGPKSEGVGQILKKLQIHPSQALFIDDSPIEIFEVSRQYEEINTFQADPEPTDTLGRLRELRGLWIDLETGTEHFRTEQYLTEELRKSKRPQFNTQDEFLRSLSIKAKIEPFTDQNLPRITQLIQRCNQFNLSTRRKTETQLRQIMESPVYQHFSIRLSDRYGDYGIVAAVIAEINSSKEFLIESWLMSCRVFNRKVEDLTLNQIQILARSLGCTKIGATYIPTRKNALIEKLLSEFNFREIARDQNEIIYQKELLELDGFTPEIPIEVLGRSDAA